MSLLSLPPELLLTIIKDEVLDKSDMKNLRLTHRHLSPFTERKIFADISLKFDKEITSNASRRKLANTTACSRVNAFLKRDDDEKHLPQKVENLLIAIKDEEKTGLKTFLKQQAKQFMGYFKEIGHLHLDLTGLTFKRGTMNKLEELWNVVEDCEEDGLQIGQFEMTARWNVFGGLKTGLLPAGLKKVTFVTIPYADKLDNYDIYDDCRRALEKILRKNGKTLECLDLSKADPLLSLDRTLDVPIIFRKDNDRDRCEIQNIHTLILLNSQLPSSERPASHFQNLKTLIIKDRTSTGRLIQAWTDPQVEIWKTFTLRQIQLKHIEVTVLSEALIDYLKTQGAGSIDTLKITSTSVIMDEKIETFIPQTTKLRYNTAGYKYQLNRIAQRFRMEAIPAIAPSLKHLTLYMRIVRAGQHYSHVNIKSRLIQESAWEETPNHITSEDLAGFHDMMNLIKGCEKLESVYLSVWDPDYKAGKPPRTFGKADKLVKGWKYTEVDEKKGEKLWRKGMSLVVEYKHQGYPVDKCARSEFVLVVEDGVWKLERVKRVNF